MSEPAYQLTRAEAIEEHKTILDEEIDRLRTMRENETDVERWLKLDNDIDALLIMKDNASATIDAARLPADRDDADILRAARTVSPNAVLVGDLPRAAYMEAQDWMTEARAQMADAKDLQETQENARL